MYILKHVCVYKHTTSKTCLTQTSPYQLLHVDFTQDSFSFDLFPVFCPFTPSYFSLAFLLIYSLVYFRQPLLLTPNAWLPPLPHNLKSIPPPRPTGKLLSSMFSFSIICPNLSFLLYLPKPIKPSFSLSTFSQPLLPLVYYCRYYPYKSCHYFNVFILVICPF